MAMVKQSMVNEFTSPTEARSSNGLIMKEKVAYILVLELKNDLENYTDC